MKTRVCVAVDTMSYREGGGHFWAYMNWLFGFLALGCDVTILEVARPNWSPQTLHAHVAGFRRWVEPYGLSNSIALSTPDGSRVEGIEETGCHDLDVAASSDLLVNFVYDLGPDVLRRFAKTALVDLDPGLLQIWMKEKYLDVSRHDVWATIGETVGRNGSPIPTLGLDWLHAPRCVALDRWPVAPPAPDAPFTTVTHWQSDDWVERDGESVENDKRAGFLPYLELPRRTAVPLELAVLLAPEEADERRSLLDAGWRLKNPHEVARTPQDYQRYVRSSRGEFSCAKPSCRWLSNAWVSDRTLCYLASGRPAVVEHTGESATLPDADGLFRFRSLDEAAAMLDTVSRDYARQCVRARALVEECFDARTSCTRILERC